MNAVAALSAPVAFAARRAGVESSKRSLRVRAESSGTAETSESWVGYTDKKGQRQTVSPAQYEAVVKNGELYKASSVTGINAPGKTSTAAVPLVEAMGFAGPAPEAINGRMAMFGFVAAVGAELASQEPVLQQLREQPTGVVLLVTLFAVATLIPLVEGRKPDTVGPFTPEAEVLNGRAAMIGFAALLVIESITGKAFF